MTGNDICPSCESGTMTIFYEVFGVPVHSVLLLETREEAVNFPTGDIRLGFCAACGFISNVAFDPALHDYSAKYEATQSYSPTFNAFAHRVATELIERHDLHGKTLIEIGCGQGEFLTLLCELGGNRGVGFDPAYRPHEITSDAKDRLTFISDFYSERYADVHGDFVACKMTLEHIHPTADFMRTVRRTVGDNPETTVFFQIPNAMYVLAEQAFWDVYYEHCSYFSMGSVARLFRRVGFDVTRLATEYDDQYLVIEARPPNGQQQVGPLPQENDLARIAELVDSFKIEVAASQKHWRDVVADIRQRNRRAVIWGGGSKGVAFLTALGIRDEIPYAVDINPLKHGTFMAGTGQEIVSPEFLTSYRPELVIIMNPIYKSEIQQSLNQLGVEAELMTV